MDNNNHLKHSEVYSVAGYHVFFIKIIPSDVAVKFHNGPPGCKRTRGNHLISDLAMVSTVFKTRV